jgi:hypothetical protein
MPSLMACRLAYTISVATLSVQTAMLLKYWDIPLGGGIGATFGVIALFNGFFPVNVRIFPSPMVD